MSMSNLLTTEDVATLLGIKAQTLREWRTEKRGPQHVKIGSRVRYIPRDVDAWLVAQRVK